MTLTLVDVLFSIFAFTPLAVQGAEMVEANGDSADDGSGYGVEIIPNGYGAEIVPNG